MKNEVYSSQWLNDGYALPRDRATINATCRFICNTHPLVNSIMNSHNEIPFNYLHIDFPENPAVKKFFENQIEKISLTAKLQYVVQEYWQIGESFIYGELDEQKGSWSNLIIQNPDYVVVKRKIVADDSQYFLRPDENLRRIVLSNKEQDQQACKLLNKTVIDQVKKGENIPLDNFYFSHIARTISPYETRGVSLMMPILKLLSSNINNQDTSSESIRTCLMDPLLNNNINMGKIKNSYRTLFTALEQWAIKKIFNPISKINDFYEYKDGDKILIAPKIKFDLDGLMNFLRE